MTIRDRNQADIISAGAASLPQPRGIAKALGVVLRRYGCGCNERRNKIRGEIVPGEATCARHNPDRLVRTRRSVNPYRRGGAHMSRITALFVGIAALTVVSTVAEAADGCGRGWYYNGRRCVPQDEPGYGYRGDYGPPIERGPVLRFDLGGGRRDEARYSPPNPAFKTWNNCPPNFTVQDGLCKPYTGPRR